MYIHTYTFTHVYLQYIYSPSSMPTMSLPTHLDFIHYSDKARKTLILLKQFMMEYIYPAEEVYSDNI